MAPFPLIYSKLYDLELGEHVFPARKYRLIRERLVARGIASEADFMEPSAATDEDMLLAHDAAWIDKLRRGKLSLAEALRLEVPFSKNMIDGMWAMSGGTILAGHHALAHGVGFNIGGGFHHAFRTHGEGFCPVNDVAVAVRRLQKDGVIAKAMIVDCDVHDGNGTAAIFTGDPSVFTFSIHQRNNYPAEKPPGSLDVELEDLTCDAEYLRQLESGLDKALAAFTPDLIYYLAGADPYAEDQLGGLLMTKEGLERRDRIVFAKAGRLPVAVTLAGGYAHRTDDTVTIHCNTVRVAIEHAAKIKRG